MIVSWSFQAVQETVASQCRGAEVPSPVHLTTSVLQGKLANGQRETGSHVVRFVTAVWSLVCDTEL